MPLCINTIKEVDTNCITLLCVTNLISRSCSPEIKNRVSKSGCGRLIWPEAGAEAAERNVMC